jgi:hypothetical protein
LTSTSVTLAHVAETFLRDSRQGRFWSSLVLAVKADREFTFHEISINKINYLSSWSSGRMLFSVCLSTFDKLKITIKGRRTEDQNRRHSRSPVNTSAMKSALFESEKHGNLPRAL